MPNQNKDTLRKLIRKRRSELSLLSQQQKSKKIVNQVYQSSTFKTAQKIAFYYAVQGEADPRNIAQLCNANNLDKDFYLPVLSKNSEQGLLFAPINQSSKYKNNKFSIPEPLCDANDLITGKELDLVLIPLLCFDKQGNRLGMGGGFYDRTFSFKQSSFKQPKKSKPTLMGFAYDFQEVDSLKAEDWDIPLDFIATESCLIVI